MFWSVEHSVETWHAEELRPNIEWAWMLVEEGFGGCH